MTTLQLASPHMKGHRVRNLQMSLKDNHFGNFLKDGEVDGVYGPMTAQAVHRAKYWLGYPEVHINQAAGHNLRKYLTGERKLGVMHRRRRAHRLRLKAMKPLRLKALHAALGKVGVREFPANTNNQEFGRWYGMNLVPWCAIFVSWCYAQAGSKAIQRGRFYHYVPSIVADARAGRNGLTITHNPQPGDLVCYDWPGESPGLGDHVGLFSHWNGPGRVAFTAVEGNTSAGSNSNGGQVQVRPDRVIGEVIAFVHIGQ